MKKILFYLFIVGSIVTQAQTSKSVEWSDSRTLSDGQVSAIFQNTEDHFYTYGSKTRLLKGIFEVNISKYSKTDFERVWDQTINDYDYNGAKARLEQVEFINNEAFVFFEAFFKDDEKKVMLLKRINAQGEIGEFEKLDEVFTTSRRRGELFIKVSKYKGKFVVLSKPKSKNKDNYTIKVTVFSDKAEELWSKEIVLDLEERVVSIEDVKISEEGEVFMLIRDYSEARQKRKENRTDLRILKITENQKEDFDELELNLKNTMSYINMEIDNTRGKAVFSGIYSDNKGKNMAGIYIGMVDQNTLEEETSHFSEFNKQFLKQAEVHLRVKDGKIKHSGGFWKLRAMIETEDEGTIMVNEYYLKQVVDRYQNGQYVGSTTYYYYHHVIASKIDSKGELEWCEFIPKLQTTTEVNLFSGLVINYSKGMLTLIFNDNPKNMNRLKQNKRLKNVNMRNSALVEVQIDDEGNSKRRIIQNNKAKKVIIEPASSINYSFYDDEILAMGSYRGRFTFLAPYRYRFGIIKL